MIMASDVSSSDAIFILNIKTLRFLNILPEISLASEKDLVLIVTKTEQKNDIMQAIMKDAGLTTKAKSILFSLPVSDTAGLHLVED